mgnify:CR=1 FL=1|jgi:uncharacterized membrane protein required for colicin V production
MGKIDLAIIIIILLFTLIGFAKGFMKQVLSVANWLLGLIGSFLLIKPFSALLSKTEISASINNKVADWIATKGDTFNQLVDYNRVDEQLAEAISELGLPKFIASAITGGFHMTGAEGDITLAEALAPTLGSVILSVIAFILLFIILIILLKIIFKFLNSIFDDGVLGVVNKLLGGVLGLLKGAVMVSLIMLLLSVLSGIIPGLNNFLIADLRLESEGFGIGKFFYESNPLLALIKGSFNFKDLLANFA